MSNSVTIRLRPEDFQVLEPSAQGMRTLAMSTSVLLMSATCAVIGGGLATLFLSGLSEALSASWLLGALVGALAGGWGWSRKLEKVARVATAPVEPMTISFDASGLTMSHPDFSSTHAWRAIAAIKKLPEHLLVTTRWSTHFVVPARDFASPADFDSYAAEALSLYNANRGAPHVQT